MKYDAYRTMGAHLTEFRKTMGVKFSVFAPHAESVSVVGDFNRWDGAEHRMKKENSTGIWSIFVPEIKEYETYKYEITKADGGKILKADPYAFHSETRPGTASKVVDINKYKWQDHLWQEMKSSSNPYEKPQLIYEVHFGSFKRKENGELYSYREMAEVLLDYVVEMGYTHIELLPLSEHPLDASWGYQVTGYYSITSRFGTPEDFMYFVDMCHLKGIGVIMDWVPGHFCRDEHGLYKFDGEALYENSNPVVADNLEWGTSNFDFSKEHVWTFLISNARFFFDIYHIDGLRVDAVASMLYLDYGRETGKWIPNQYGGRENLQAVSFLRKLNEVIFSENKGALMIAEESTAWPMVTAPAHLGGLGFNYKWNMGWMNDTLKYMELDPIYRKWYHNNMTFSFTYTFAENYILPLSHDEVVHGKKSLLDKMSGDYWQKFANLRDYYAYMMAHPGKKLLFMGGEIGQFIEWRYYEGLDWLLLDYDMHRKLQYYVKSLNNFYKECRALWENDHNSSGLDFIDGSDFNNSVITFLRRGKDEENFIIAVCNFTPVVRYNYRIGVPDFGIYTEVFNSDSKEFGGSGQLNEDNLYAENLKWHNKPYSLEIKLPPLATIYLKLNRKLLINKLNNAN